MKLALCLCLTCLACLAAAGCTPDVSPRPGLGDPVPAPFNNPEITILDAPLQSVLGFQPAIIQRDREKGLPMQVQVPVRNLADPLYLIDYRFIFYDENGVELEPVMSWRRQELRSRQTVTLKAGAMTVDAVRYRLEIKWAR